AIWYDLNRGDVIPHGEESTRNPVELGGERGLQGGFYVGDEVHIMPGLTLYGGLRISYFALVGPGTVNLYYPDAPKDEETILDQVNYGSGEIIKFYGGPEPRLALNLSTGTNSSVKFSYNRLRQYLYMLTNTIAISPVDQWKLVDYHIKPPISDQVSAGYYMDFPRKGINATIEAYYKKTQNLVEFKDAAEFLSSPYIETEVLQGDQSAYGLEFMLKKNAGKLNGCISYAYSRSIVLVDGPLPWDKINNGNPYPSNYDKPHAVNLVSNYRITRRLSFSSNMVYSTGRPITAPKDIYYMNAQPIVNYSERNEYRIPDYFRIDVSMNIEGNLKARKLAHSYWMINVYNLTGRKNAYSVFFKSEEGQINGYKMSIFGAPIVTISWNFKLGNYASE
ncbi:MAG: TonB-dependent receptor, partial [Bacteroidales bacterium]|nr:TonB-dependent receptor [Bacteroidales bacterium]